MRLAFVTAGFVTPGKTDDVHLQRAAEAAGHTVSWVTWDASGVDWRGYDAVVLRSPWDYHTRPDEFRTWVEACARDGVRLWNPPSVVLANMHKRYLLDLAAAGIPIPPSRLFRRGDEPALPAGGDAVVKPAISGGGWRTVRTNDLAVLRSELAERDILVQAFVPEIQDRGEWALVFIDGRYTHAVRKLPAAGDFRVQTQYGGTVVPDDPPPAVLELAHRTLALTAPDAAIYARMDIVDTPAGPLLMEAELLDCWLFFAEHPPATEALLQALASR